ncbi:hypothetical protein [Nakamurella sp. PAMC28650]|uniref:hypothetical protein n=1 Tax=Nakamurella sp. PAMC28650 TaxID=2762325 RepID=UPI00164ECBE0|nr:hypothetical protein [Nakamurella sp. PAMC28650]QNK82898.1 hypothetical protein H7F38_09625 [Nakamurella sp. PAMC28650]
MIDAPAPAAAERTSFTSVRYSVPLPGVFEQAVCRFEAAVPEYPMRDFHALIHKRAAWSEVLELADANAPWGFMTYWLNDIGAGRRRGQQLWAAGIYPDSGVVLQTDPVTDISTGGQIRQRLIGHHRVQRGGGTRGGGVAPAAAVRTGSAAGRLRSAGLRYLPGARSLRDGELASRCGLPAVAKGRFF